MTTTPESPLAAITIRIRADRLRSVSHLIVQPVNRPAAGRVADIANSVVAVGADLAHTRARRCERERTGAHGKNAKLIETNLHANIIDDTELQ